MEIEYLLQETKIDALDSASGCKRRPGKAEKKLTNEYYWTGTMAKCNGTRSDGAYCGQTKYECPECGFVGCVSHDAHCTHTLQDARGRCVYCGSATSPRKYFDFSGDEPALRIAVHGM